MGKIYLKIIFFIYFLYEYMCVFEEVNELYVVLVRMLFYVVIFLEFVIKIVREKLLKKYYKY